MKGPIQIVLFWLGENLSELADVYTFPNGKAIQMRALADRQEALRWVGAKVSSR